MADTASLEKMLTQGMDNALLRFGLGKAYLDNKAYPMAIEHLRKAVEFDADYSAAWKLLGRALAADEQAEAAREAYQQGIAVAERRGDIQAAKEMRVFLKRVS